MQSILSLMAAAAGLALAALAFAPHAAQAQHQPLIKPGICAQGSVPVCAVKQKILVTYVNACVARSVNAKVLAPDRGCFDGCPAKYVPVCGTAASGKRQLYGNACEAQKSGATDIQKGRCRLIRRNASPGAAAGAVP
jgi:hypothetical protein